jgi:hypothetical protein
MERLKSSEDSQIQWRALNLVKSLRYNGEPEIYCTASDPVESLKFGEEPQIQWRT